MWSEHRFVSFDKLPIFFRRLRAGASPKGVVLVLHGMGEHGGRYKEFAEHLAGQGLTSYLPDLRGFGRSGGKRGCLGEFTDYFKDLEVVRRLAAAWEPARRPFVFGHSYGGLVAASYLAATPSIEAKGLVLSSPNFGIAIRIPAWRKLLASLIDPLFPDLTQSNRVEAATLTHDATVLQARASDRLMHDRVSAHLFLQLTERIEASQKTASEISVPALVLQAGDDRVVSRAATERFYQALASTDKRLQVYEGLYHELLNEGSRQAIFKEISSWMLQRA